MSESRSALPKNLNREICSSCKIPPVGYMALAPGLKMCFLPSHVFEHVGDFPDPGLHTYYDHRVGDIEDSLPKRRNYRASNLGFTEFIMPRLLAR